MELGIVLSITRVIPFNPYSWVDKAIAALYKRRALLCPSALVHCFLCLENPTPNPLLQGSSNYPCHPQFRWQRSLNQPHLHPQLCWELPWHPPWNYRALISLLCLAPLLNSEFLKDSNLFLKLCILTLQFSALHDTEPTLNKYLLSDWISCID